MISEIKNLPKAVEIEDDNYKVDLGKQVEIGIIKTNIHDYIDKTCNIDSLDIDYSNYDGIFYATYGKSGIGFKSIIDLAKVWGAIKLKDVKAQVVMNHYKFCGDSIKVVLNHPTNAYIRAMADTKNDDDIIDAENLDYQIYSDAWGILIDVAPYFILNEILNRGNTSDCVLNAFYRTGEYYTDIDDATSYVILDGENLPETEKEREVFIRKALIIVSELAETWYNEDKEYYDKLINEPNTTVLYEIGLDGITEIGEVEVGEIKPLSKCDDPFVNIDKIHEPCGVKIDGMIESVLEDLSDHKTIADKRTPAEKLGMTEAEYNDLCNRTIYKHVGAEVDRGLGKIILEGETIDIKDITIETVGESICIYNDEDLITFNSPSDLAYVILTKSPYLYIQSMLQVSVDHKDYIDKILNGTLECGAKAFFDWERSDELYDMEDFEELNIATQDVTYLLFDYTCVKLLNDFANKESYTSEMKRVFNKNRFGYDGFHELCAGTTSNLVYDGEHFNWDNWTDRETKFCLRALREALEYIEEFKKNTPNWEKYKK